MESDFARQSAIINELERINVNFKKDGADRKTREYIDRRIKALDELWQEFRDTHSKLEMVEDKSHEYYTKNIYQKTKEFYESVRLMLSVYPPTPRVPAASVSTPGTSNYTPSKPEENTTTTFNVPKIVAADVSNKTIEELMAQQNSNIRAFYRTIQHIHIESIDEKWELEDEIKNLQRRWNIIDELHLRIDCILQGSNAAYEEHFLKAEKKFNLYKKELNRRLSSTAHLQQSTPKVEIPIFSGKYTQWPTFYDLFTEAIHDNRCLNKAQKMQHLKSKVRGEAERIIQHLHITAENYDTAWDLLTHRYNNPNALFTHQIELFLNQPSLQKQSSYELKRLYDTTMETVHAIHNLGVDTQTWDPILVHLVAKKLDTNSYIDYKESLDSPRELPSFDELMKFIESKFTALEPIRKGEKETTAPVSKSTSSLLRRPVRFNHGFNKSKENYHNNHQNSYQNNYHNNQNRSLSKNYQSIATFTRKCPLCYMSHDLSQCKRFIELPVDSMLKTVAKLEVCKNCLYKHYGNKCTSTKRCKECNGEHNSILHDALGQSPSTRAPNKSNSDGEPSQPTERKEVSMPENKNYNVNHVAKDDEEILLTTLSLQVKAEDGSYITLRALLDQGSQISLISENAAQMLGLQRLKYHASVSGIGDASKQSRGIVSIECQSIHDDYHFTTQALVISRVINYLPNTSFDKQSWPHLQHLKLADPHYNVSKPIDILLDASVYSEIIMSGLIKGPAQAPIAQQTKLGWILSGYVKTFHCHAVINNVDEIAKYWELEDISNSSPTFTKEEQYCEDLYQSTTRRLEDGRYEVALPMKPDFKSNLGTSKPKALAQFRQLEKKMAKNQLLAEKYRQFMQEYQELGHMRQANDIITNESLPTCYLPHHGVVKPDSTTTNLRAVFNASSLTSSGKSLNDLMECGPNLQQDLLSLIIKWRKYKFVVTADIEKMFRQIYLRTSDQYLQTIIWRNSPNELLRAYHLTTVTYGTKAAPFLAMRTLRQIAKDYVTTHPLAAVALETSFYMDDLLTGHDSVEQVKLLQNQLIDVLRRAGMNLRKWSSNEPELIKEFTSDQVDSPFQFKDRESRKTLGIQWNPASDTFTYQNKLDYNDEKTMTKRQMLSDLSKIYDPLGWISPITIRAKLLFQKTWLQNLSWDDQLPQDLMNEWLQLRNDLKAIDRFIIPRHLGEHHISFHLHGYSDASEKAYACAIYAVTQDSKGEYTSQLVAAKTKVAPCKNQVSLPRLELLGALLLSQLMKKVLDSLSLTNINITAWTDSMVVLGWLQGDPAKWKQFVSNRVRQVTEIIPPSSWRYVKSEENAADCATRGMSTKLLSCHYLWWQGHKTLLEAVTEPTSPVICPTPTIEVKKNSVNAALQSNENSIIIKLLHNSSSITKVINIVGWISRFIKCARAHKRANSALCGKMLTSNEIQDAYNYIIKVVQSIYFEDDIKHLKKHGHVRSSSKLSSLDTFVDDVGILRVGGRLENANLTYGAKHPVVLPTHSRLTELIIYEAHMKTLHGGPKVTLSTIRDKFWIIGGVRTVKKQLRQCVKCQRHKQQSCQQIMADLPQPRVTPARPFTNTGVDFTGFVDIKSNKGRGIRTTKGYVAVFVCLATKAVHLELVSDLSSTAFLAAFRRLCSRRGCPKNMFSDNGTNFVGASRILKKEHKDIIASIDPLLIKNSLETDINWHFNAPAWPNASGLMEAAVKSLKYHLKRVLGEQKLTYEEFITLLHQIEAILNSRPLCALTEDIDDLCLTPGHFLVGDAIISRPQTEPETLSHTSRWRLVQEMNKQFWKKWSSEYLQQLQSRSKWRTETKNLNTNDVVVIKEDNMPPGKWALGRVQEVHPGQDGLVRVVTLKTQSGYMKRPVNKLILLPTESIQEQQQSETKKEEYENSKRHRKPILKNIFTTIFMLFMMLSPSMQQSVHNYNITSLSHQSMYFDKIADLQHIRDEWKLIVYYNLSSYWEGVSDIRQYVIHIKQLSKNMGLQYSSIILQLEHELNEIDHYNRLLVNSNKRQKRGLVNGVGYIANSLFGVLDERFAEQYKRDIQKIALNENHLQTLLKNQTSIIAAELNMVKRNEDIMNKQFTLIKQHLYNLTTGLERISLDNSNGMFVTSTSLAASVVDLFHSNTKN